MADSDKEAEFAFDLFSDIAPLLALFGDQFARQFASESLTWVDHLIFAMVPLGILTAITGAIRVQGPGIAKSFIGRGRENRAVAEIELMSSTSKEVCELFNGKSIVRAMGKPKIAQILVFPQKYEDLKREYESKNNEASYTSTGAEDLSCGIHSLKTAVLQKGSARPLMECVEYHSYSYNLMLNMVARLQRLWGSLSSSESIQTETGKPPNFDWLGPPNLQLGLSSNQYDQGPIRKGQETFLAAIAAVVLQAGLIALATVTVYHSRTRKAISFEPKAYGYPCYITGTALLCIGIAICSKAIERNTTEYEWRVPLPMDEQGEETTKRVLWSPYKPKINESPRLLWLQQRQEVNDQAFDGYVILAGPKHHVVTSSRLEDTERHHKRYDSSESRVSKSSVSSPGASWARLSRSALRWLLKGPQEGIAPSKNNPKWEILTVCGAALAGSGFIIQFMGLRGLTYPCSIAQLIAIILMALIRAIIRRRLGRMPPNYPSLAGYEIDYLATCLVRFEHFRKYEEGSDLGNPTEYEPHQVLQWRIKTAENGKQFSEQYDKQNLTLDILHTVGDRDPPEFLLKVPKKPSATKSSDASAPEPSAPQPSALEPSAPPPSALQPSASQPSTSQPSCQQLIRVRERLGDLCGWRSSALESALALATSIEAFLDEFLPPKSGADSDFFEWALETIGFPTTECQDQSCSFVTIPVEREKSKGKWRADIGKIEAILSLWMASIEAPSKIKNEEEKESATSKASSERAVPTSNSTNWRREKAGTLRYRFCRILGNNPEHGKLKRDLSWWVDELIAEQSDSVGEDSKGDEVEGEGKFQTWSCSKARKENLSLIIGFSDREDSATDSTRSSSNNRRELAINDTGSLSTILAQHLFTSFMWTAVERLPEDCLRPGFADAAQEVEIDGRHTFDVHDLQKTWYRPTLRHRKLTRLVRDLEKFGLGKYTDILLCMIPALSSKDLLPDHVILKLIAPMTQDQSWAALARAYTSLLGTNMCTSPAELFCYSVVVEAMDFLQTACEPYNACIKPQIEIQDGLEDLVMVLMSTRYAQILTELAPVYAIQQRWTHFQNIFNQYRRPTDTKPVVNEEKRNSTPDAGTRADDRASSLSDKPRKMNLNFCIDKLGLSQSLKGIYIRLESENLGPLSRMWNAWEDRKSRPTIKDAKSSDIFGWCPLHYAALLKDESMTDDLMKRVLNNRESLNIHKIYTKSSQTPLHVAMRAGNEIALNWILPTLGGEEKRNVCNAFGLDQMTPLHLSIRSGSWKCFKAILDICTEKGLTKPDFWGREPIHLACSEGHVEIAKRLLDNGVQPFTIDSIGLSPADYLLTGDVDLNSSGLSQGESKRFQPGGNKREIFISLALKHPDFRDKLGQTFLHRAIQQADTETVQKLLEAGYEIEQPDAKGRSALHLASLGGHHDMAQLLIKGLLSHDKGGGPDNVQRKFVADAAALDNQSETPLMLAAREGHVNIVELLMLSCYPNDPDRINEPERMLELARNLRVKSALHLAIDQGHYDSAMVLLKAQLSQENYNDNEEQSLLLVTACRREPSGKRARASWVECVRALIQTWPDAINDPDLKYGQTPLSWACEFGHASPVQELLSHENIDMNKQASKYKNYAPLHVATWEEHKNIVELLLDSAKIDSGLRDADGDTALDMAVRYEDASVVPVFFNCPKREGQIRPRCLDNLSAQLYGNFRNIIPELYAEINHDNIHDDDLLQLVEMAEDLVETAPWEILARLALKRGTTKMRVNPGPMHIAARLNDVGLMKEVCKFDGIENKVFDDDGWTCIEYAQTYGVRQMETEIETLAKPYIPKKQKASGRAMPMSLDLEAITGISERRCGISDHGAGSCLGFHVVQIMERITFMNCNYIPKRTSIRAQTCVPPLSVFYHEIKVINDSETKIVGIGFCNKEYDRMTMLGWSDISFAYHGDDGNVFVEDGDGSKPQGSEARYATGDTVGVGLNSKTGNCFVTRNGKRLDFGNVLKRANSKFSSRKMYPCVGFDNEKGGIGLSFEWNLGASLVHHPFIYKGPYE